MTELIALLKPISDRGRTRIDVFIKNYKSSFLFPSTAKLLPDGSGQVVFKLGGLMAKLSSDKLISLVHRTIVNSAKEPMDGDIDVMVWIE